MIDRQVSNLRISLQNILSYENGYVAGRVENIEKSSLYLSDENGVFQFYFREIDAKVKAGDFVSLFFLKDDENYFIDKLVLLNSVAANPVGDTSSPYHRLNRNNKKLLHTLYNRQDFFLKTRLFFINNNFLELHSPTLVESPGIESYIEPFITEYFDYNNKGKTYYLPTSPEFSLKEALSSGVENIFEIAKSFRNNGEKSRLHNPEFFMLEWYRAYKDFFHIMDDCAKFLLFIAKEVYKRNYILYNGKKCFLDNVKRIRLKELFNEHNLNLDDYSLNENKFITDVSGLLGLSKTYVEESNFTKEDLFFKFFLEHIEPTLGFDNPVIVYDYPIDMCALSERCKHDANYGERFELYICGIELANAFGELIDPEEQRKRFEKIIAFRNEKNSRSLSMPQKFIKALYYGLPPCSGIALGLERLFMLFEELSSISETNFFTI